MGNYTKKLTGASPLGEHPDNPGQGFTVEKLEIPGQSGTDEPVTAYRVFDRHDGRVIMSGVELPSTIDDVIERQVWLLSKATSGPEVDFTLFRREHEPDRNGD